MKYKYNPIIQVDISSMYTGHVAASNVVHVLTELLNHKCRIIVTCSFVPRDRILSFLKAYDINITHINEPFECTLKALGNTVDDTYIYSDYKFVVSNNSKEDIENACSIDNFYMRLYDFDDGAHIGFKHGNFDDWCIDFHDANGKVINPRDEYYFGRLLKIAIQQKCHSQIYEDFLDIYNVTTDKYNSKIMDIIVEMSRKYDDCSTEFRNCMAMIYFGMIAEENKKNAILKKRVKHLGMYQVFVEKLDVVEAARFSAGMKWYDLDSIMTKMGI